MLWKILTQNTIEDENELAEREVFPKTINEQVLTNLPSKAFFSFCSVFSQGQTEERWKRLLDRHSVRFPKYSSTLSFDQINFFNMANLFLLSLKAFVMCYCFRASIKTFCFDTCQMTVKSCVLHLFPVTQTGRSHITICHIAISFFRSVL